MEGAGNLSKPTKLPPVAAAGRGVKLPPVKGLKSSLPPIGFSPLSTLVPPGKPSSSLMVPLATRGHPPVGEHYIQHQDTEELKDFLKNY